MFKNLNANTMMYSIHRQVVTVGLVLICWIQPFILAENKIICQGHKLHITCPHGKVLVFNKANYGRTDSTVCNPHHVTDCVLPSTVSKLNRKYFGKSECDLDVDDREFGNPCPNVEKYLEVDYQCIDESQIFEGCKERYHKRIEGLKEGYITSPNYPDLYDGGRDCLVSSLAEDGRRFNTDVLDLDVEARTTSGCYDRLVVQDAKDASRTFNYCGLLHDIATYEPRHAEQFKHLIVKFTSDPVTNHAGFLLRFTDVEELPEPYVHDDL